MPNVFKNSITGSIGITGATVYTVPAATSTTVIGMSVANTSTTSNINVSATLTSGSSTVYLVRNTTVPVGGSVVLVGGEQKIVLTAANSLAVSSSVASSADVVVSVLEIS
jgi:hypothetical protein